MNRVWILTLYFTRDLFRSLSGVVPLAAALVFGLVAFEYGMDQPQFITVGGLGTGAICLLTTLLLAGRANRAASYPFVARLRQRAELLTAPIVGALVVTALLAFLIALANLLTDRLTLEFPSLLWIVPTWFVLWSFMAALALSLSSLVNRGGFQVLGYVLVVGVLVANDREAWLTGQGFHWLGKAVDIVLWPMSMLLANATAGSHERTYFLAVAATFAFALLLYALAVLLFGTKDLLWPE
jgi:hypothetical protein